MKGVVFLYLFSIFFLPQLNTLKAEIIPSSCTVALDIGHTPLKYGATSARGNKEYDFNRNMGIELFYALQERGVGVFFINRLSQEVTLMDRVRESNQKTPDIFFSIHHDSVGMQFLKPWKVEGKKYFYSDLFSGYSIFVSQKNAHFKESLAVAKKIGSILHNKGYVRSHFHEKDIRGERKYLYDESLGIYKYDNLVVLKRSTAPSVLLECGVLVNREEEERFTDRVYIKEFARNIAKGLENACFLLTSTP